MNNMMNKNLAALLVLATASLPLVAKAGNLTVTAEVAEIFGVQHAENLSLSNNTGEVKIKLLSNKGDSTGGFIHVDAPSADAVDGGFKLHETGAGKKGELPVKVKLGNADMASGKVVSAAVIAKDVEETLKVTADPDVSSPAGIYTGTLTVTATAE